MRLSKFGQKFGNQSGIAHLMDDLGKAMTSGKDMLMLGGGNPSHIPGIQTRFRARMQQIMADGDALERIIGNYDGPAGTHAFIDALADLLRRECGWNVGPENIALTNGSQTSFFYLFNMFSGVHDDGSYKKIMLPLAPEYIGYVETGLRDDIFTAYKPEIDFLDEHTFKYRVDFDALTVTDEIGAICVSRPTNPTGNVLTDDEISRLSVLAKANNIPLILDNAYGTPFPNIIFADATPLWDEHIIVCMSLSKLGLPGLRTGIIIANEQVIRNISAMNAIISLAPGSFGPALALDMVQSGEVIHLSQTVIQPYYQQKAMKAMEIVRETMAGLDFYVHKAEGALFLWLWFKDLPITSQDLYERLKHRQTLIVPGHHFFPGLNEPWAHKHECIRITYSQDEAVVRAGVTAIAAEVKGL